MADSKLSVFKQNGDEGGYLVAMEGESEGIPFLIRRAFYIYGSDRNVVRGCHANYNTEFVLINVQGSCRVKTDNGLGSIIEYELNERNEGVYIPAMVWKDMYDFSPDCIMLALASEHYDPDEYIRDYELFVRRVMEDGNRRIRPLEEKDAPFMLEWMQDPAINRFFKFSLGDITLDKALHFIKRANKENENDDEPSYLHYAVVDGKDEYFGTVSLKNINWQDKTAEYAISTRKCAKHRGYGQFATREIIKKAFEDLPLERVFLYVLPENESAIKMYKKCGFVEEPSRDSIETVRGRDVRRLYYRIDRDDYYSNKH